MRKANADPIIAGVLALLGAAMALYSIKYTVIGAGGRIGPGFMPFVAGCALALFALWAGAEAVLRGRRDRPNPAGPGTTTSPADTEASSSGPAADDSAPGGDVAAGDTEGSPAATDAATPGAPGAQHPGRKLVTVFALAVAAAALTPLIGFLIAFGLLIFALLAGVEREPLWLAGVITVAAVVVSWLVFVQLLGVPLPGGAIGLLGN